MPQPTNSFQNQEAEFAVCMFVCLYGQIPAGLVADDFTHSECRDIFQAASRLKAEGRAISAAALQVDAKLLEAFEQRNWLNVQAEDVAGLLKECSYRRALCEAIEGTPVWDRDKYDKKATATLVQMVDEKAKAKEADAKPYRELVEKHVPTLAEKPIDWAGLETGKDIQKQQGTTLDYIVNEILPKHRVTMLFGQEKSGKSIIALDLLAHITSGKKWLNREVQKTPCLYIDMEDGILGSYIGWLRAVGSEEVRFITIRSKSGIPALDNPGLLALCAEKQPVIVLDSLHKLFTREKERKGASAWNAGDYEPVLEKIRQLCVAGATVILIHHSTKQDGEQYRDSSAIGANVDFLFAVVGDEPENGVKRIHLIGKPSRGAQPPTVHILAFPHIIEHGHLCLDAGLEKEDCAAYEAANEVRQNGPAESRNALAKRIGGTRGAALEAIKRAISFGYLIQAASGEVNLGSMPLAAPTSAVPVPVPVEQNPFRTDSRTDGSEPF